MCLQWQFEDNPPLQHTLTVVLLVQIVFILAMLFNEPSHAEQTFHPLVLLGISLIVVSCFVYAVNVASEALSVFLKRTLVRLKLVTSMPVHSKVLLKKWQDRSWQFIVHVTMTAMEVYVLTTDLSGVWSDPDQSWEPDPWEYRTPYTVRLLYIVQFVSTYAS